MTLNRRTMVGAGASAMLAMTIPGVVGAKRDATPALGIVAGGGAVETELGLVDFAFTAQAGTDGTVAGALTLNDFTVPGAPTVVRSIQFGRIEAYDADLPTARQLFGWATGGGKTAPFLLRVNDVGGPGSGDDTFGLYMGTAASPFLEGEEQAICDCQEYTYQTEGVVVRGDILVIEG